MFQVLDGHSLLINYFSERRKGRLKIADGFFFMHFVCLRLFLRGIIRMCNIRELRERGRRIKKPARGGLHD